MKNPLVSVVMSVYNEQENLALAIESILNQTYTNLELIIINDGSNDGSIEVIKNYMANDKRIILIDRGNKGLPYSLNEGIKKSSGKYIARMDADDICFLNRIERQIQYMINTDCDLVYSNTALIDKHGDYICNSIRPSNIDIVMRNLKVNNFIPHPTVMIKKKCFEEIGYYNESCFTGQDLELWLRFKNKIRFSYLPEVLLYYRLSPNSIRKGIYDEYWFKVANYCIGNGSKSKALTYLNKLKPSQKLIIFIKLFLPLKFFYRKLNVRKGEKLFE